MLITKAEKRKAKTAPDPLPIVVNKGHTTVLKGTLSGKEAVVFEGRCQSFLEGTTLCMRVRFLSVPSEKWKIYLPLWGTDGTSMIHVKPLLSVTLLPDGEGLEMEHPANGGDELFGNTELIQLEERIFCA